MLTELKRAVLMTLALTVITGIAYPLATLVLARALFPYQSGGSLIVRGDRIVGSSLIGQNFSSNAYFHPRPSAAGDNGYDPMASGGSNLGPTNAQLISRVGDAAAQLHAENPAQPVPVDLVTTSGSGLDPDITPAAAAFQIPRIAGARSLPVERVQRLVQQYTQPRQLGVLGEPRVNVLQLNLALDALGSQ